MREFPYSRGLPRGDFSTDLALVQASQRLAARSHHEAHPALVDDLPRAARRHSSMIGEALQCVVRDLNHHLPGAVPGGRHRLVSLMALAEQESQATRTVQNTVALTLTALEEERNFMEGGGAAARGGPSLARHSEQIFLNLHVLFAANHADHKHALDALSSVIGYIKAKPVFDARNTTRFPPGLQRLTFAMERLDYSALSNLWSYLGAKYLPSACYTIRVVGVGQRRVEAVVPAIAEAEVEA